MDTVSIAVAAAAKGLSKHSHRKSPFRALWTGMRRERGGYLAEKKERAARCGFGKTDDDRWRTFSEVYGTASPNKFADIQIQAGDEVRIVSPGGGGYGPPERREPSEVLDDVREGLVSPEDAREVYAVMLVREAGDWRVDEETTADLRRESRRLSERRRIS